jgi:hypothetical protein
MTNTKEKQREYARRYREKNREKVRAQNRAWAKRHPEVARLATERWQKRNPEKCRINYQRSNAKRHGIPEPTRPMPDRCELRGCLPGKFSLVRDHNHRTGKFRGWICALCNTALGKLGDDIEGVQQALDYLRRSE